jgi:hypothetical protein
MATSATKVALGIGCGILLVVAIYFASCVACFGYGAHKVAQQMEKDAARTGAPTASTADSGDSSGRDDELWRQCKLAVLQQLRAPSTATFLGEDSAISHQFLSRDLVSERRHVFPRTTAKKNKKLSPEQFAYEVTGELDAQNGFGAMIRSSFVCSLHFTKDGRLVMSAKVDPLNP